MAVDEPAITVDARAGAARVDGRTLVVSLVDGREIRVPVDWFPRLATGSPRQQANLEITEGGRALHWPDLDEDVGIEPLLAITPGTGSPLGPTHRSKASRRVIEMLAEDRGE